MSDAGKRLVATLDQMMVVAKEIEALAAQAGWQPISTAPKDGTNILLFIPAPINSRGFIWIGRWGASHDSDVKWWRDEDTDELLSEPERAEQDGPTHWMHLPSPPQ